MLLLLVVTNLVPRNLCDRSVKNNPIFFHLKNKKKKSHFIFLLLTFFMTSMHILFIAFLTSVSFWNVFYQILLTW